MAGKWFLSQKRARVGLVAFLIVFLFSMTAEIWSNHRPLIMVRDHHWFFPAFIHYHPSHFQLTDTFVIDYELLMNNDHRAGKKTWAIFPINHWDPYEQTGEMLLKPSSQHWLGTDALGRDVVARLIYGIRVSLSYGLLFWLFSFGFGIILGAIQGYFAGKIDFILERVKELLEILPLLSVVILINGLMNANSFLTTLMIAVLFSWVHVSSQVRAQFLSLRKQEFCEAARAGGASSLRIIVKHILPNALTPLLTLTPFSISSGIAILAVLDYLGFGLSPPTPSLGELLQEGRANIQNSAWLLIAPTLALSWMLISINLIGEAMRDALSPHRSKLVKSAH